MQFAAEVGSTYKIIDGLVKSGTLETIDCNGIRILTPRARERWRELWDEVGSVTKRDRNKFERRERDSYATPLEAIAPLIPWLAQGDVRISFAEPCVGDGALARVLESFGLTCTYSGDIGSGQDALQRTDYGDPTVIITNPPWDRAVLHAMITHFQAIAPTWLLIDSDWANLKSARPYLETCTDILAIGRVKWIPGSKSVGFDNASWYRFQRGHIGGPRFHPYRSEPNVSTYIDKRESPEEIAASIILALANKPDEIARLAGLLEGYRPKKQYALESMVAAIAADEQARKDLLS